MADFSVPDWLKPRDWSEDDGVDPGRRFLGAVMSGYTAGQTGQARRSHNKAVDEINELRGEYGGSPIDRIKGNGFTDILGSVLGANGAAANQLSPKARLAYEIQRKQLDYTEQQVQNQWVKTQLDARNQLNKEKIENLTNGAVATFSDTWSQLTEAGEMGTDMALSQLQGIVAKNPIISENPLVKQALTMAESAITLRQKSDSPTASIREAEQADEWLQEANEAEKLGNSDMAQRLRAKAQQLTPKGFSLETYTDDQGHQQFRMTQGLAAPVNGQMKPTVGTTTDVQKGQLSSENSIKLGSKLMGSITGDMVGVKGFVNDVVLNQGVAQLFPELANKKVASGRTLIRLFNEKAVKSMKADSQLNRDERAHLESALPRLTPNESLESAKSKIATFVEESRDIARVNAERTGQPLHNWMLTKDEVAEKFKAGGFDKDPSKNEEIARQLLLDYHYKD